MASAEPAHLADTTQPFSPSDFLNLPPTPRLDLDEDQDQDLMIISRMLMEEEAEMDSFFFDKYHPDHPALLQAQQPFADILSDAAANSSGTTTMSPASAADGTPAAFTNATWPYDPVELSQLLHSRSTYPNADSLSSSSSSMFGSGGTVSMDMLILAFLKGMEEASKFLPDTNNNSLLMPIVSVSRDGGDHGGHGHHKLSRARQPNKIGKQGAQGGNNNGRHKNTRHVDWDDHDDDDDAETTTGGRRSGKVHASEPEESEMVDEFVESGYQLLHEQMRAMTISSNATDSINADTKKNINRKGHKKGRSATNDEAVDLRTLLIHCAQAVASGDRANATNMLSRIKERSSPRGDATQRLAHCFAKGLEARLAGTGNQLYGSRSLTTNSKLASSSTSIVELLGAYQLYFASCCFTAMASNKVIAIAVGNTTVKKKKKVHIVDYGNHHGFQWPTLLGYWGAMEGGPPEVRLTTIDHPQPGFRPAAQIQDTGRRLTTFARRHGVPFKFHSVVAANWETVTADDLNINHDDDELLVVNGLFHFGNKLSDEGTSDIDNLLSLSPRDMVLGNIRRMRPDVFVLCVENSWHKAPFFVTRFREAMFYYSALFDMMDALAPRDSDERVLIEQQLFGQCALNAIACEGADRVERHETYRQWQVRSERAGLRQLPLDPEMVKGVSKKVKVKYHKDFVVDVDQQWLLQGWKGRILYAMSAWVANDEDSIS